MGIQYKHPLLYKLFIPLIHRRPLLREFREQVGKNHSVFDVAAGFGLMASYIDPSNEYYGIDLNEQFVRYGQKHGLNLEIKDIFDADSYKSSDAFVLVDVIHHLPPQKLEPLFDLIFSHARAKVIIVEPAFLNLRSKYGIFGSIVDWLLKQLDNDGNHKITKWLTTEEYDQLFESRFDSKKGQGFGLTSKKVYPYSVITYSRE